MTTAITAWRAAFNATVITPLAQTPGRVALAIIGIALGVALGVAVHVINASALNEFGRAMHSLAGEADIVIRGPRGGFAEDLYPRVAHLPQVQAASPALEIEAHIAGRRETLIVMGVDPFRAAQVQPALIGDISADVLKLFDPRAILITTAAADAFGHSIAIVVGASTVELNVIGVVASDSAGRRFGLMDISSAQWTFAQLGRLNRIDVRVRTGTDVAAFQSELQRMLPPGVQAMKPDDDAARAANITRAYRVNLDMLALVALLTGAFVVFATQYLALLRRRQELALLRALGVTRRSLLFLLLCEAAIVGIIGATLGLVAGVALAVIGVERFDSDLGAGYFATLTPALLIAWRPLCAFFALGVGAALLGALAPARNAANRPPAAALKAGDEQAERRRGPVWPGLSLVAVGAALAGAPPVFSLPLFGYAAVAALLLGTMLLMPRVVTAVVQRLPALKTVSFELATAQLAGTPRQVSISTASIVASFSLMVAMLIMVVSFRGSLDAWLARMLPADLYVRSSAGGETAFLTPDEQMRIASLPGVDQTQFVRSRTLLLAPDRPPVVLLARTVEAQSADRTLPLTSQAITPREDQPPPVWVSEIAADLYGWRVGDEVRLPLSESPPAFTVAGVWRDYARQSGAIVIDRALYVRLTGDRLVTDAAVTLAPGASSSKVAMSLRERFDSAGIEIIPTAELRARSLKIFDRTFAITYALEAAAVVIGLFGVGISFSAQTLARRREFGMLRHIGMTRRQIGTMLATEGALTASIGAVAGLALGFCQSLILVHVVNRQSFHWTMDLSIPWLALGGLTVTLIAASAITSTVSGRRAMSEEAVHAVREDW